MIRCLGIEESQFNLMVRLEMQDASSFVLCELGLKTESLKLFDVLVNHKSRYKDLKHIFI